MHKTALEALAKQASSRFLANGAELDRSIFEIAAANGLNDEQMKRVVEMTNTIVNGELVNQAKAHGENPSVSFKMANYEGIKNFAGDVTMPVAAAASELFLFGDEAEKTASDASAEAGLYQLPAEKTATAADDAAFFEKIALADGHQSVLSHVDPAELAGAYMGIVPWEQEVYVTVDTLASASDIIAETRREAEMAVAQNENASEKLAGELDETINALILDGVSPMTMVTIVSRTLGDDGCTKIAATHISKVAGIRGIEAGTNQLQERAIVMEDHPLIQMVKKAQEVAQERHLLQLVVDELKATDFHVKQATLKAKTERVSQEKTAMRLQSLVPKSLGPIPGVAITGVGAYMAANDTTKRLKAAQKTPVVGAVKMARSTSFGDAATAAIGLTAAGAAIALAGRGLDAGINVIGNALDKMKHKKLYEELLLADPTLADNPRAREAFDIIVKFAPAMLKSPRAVHDFIKRQLSYPQTSVEFLSNLAQFQKTHSDGMRGGGPGFGSTIAGGFMTNLSTQMKN